MIFVTAIDPQNSLLVPGGRQNFIFSTAGDKDVCVLLNNVRHSLVHEKEEKEENKKMVRLGTRTSRRDLKEIATGEQEP